MKGFCRKPVFSLLPSEGVWDFSPSCEIKPEQKVWVQGKSMPLTNSDVRYCKDILDLSDGLSEPHPFIRSELTNSVYISSPSCFMRLFWAFICSMRSSSANFAIICLRNSSSSSFSAAAFLAFSSMCFWCASCRSRRSRSCASISD